MRSFTVLWWGEGAVRAGQTIKDCCSQIGKETCPLHTTSQFSLMVVKLQCCFENTKKKKGKLR